MAISAEQRITYKAKQLFHGESWLKRRQQAQESGELFDETELKVLMAISEIPGFCFLVNEQKKAVFKMGLVVKSYFDWESQTSKSLNPLTFRDVIYPALEVAREVGTEFAQIVLDTVFNSIEESTLE